MVLLAKFLLLLFMIIVVHGDIVVDVMQEVHSGGGNSGGCWNPIYKMRVKNGTIVNFGGCILEICINGYWIPDSSAERFILDQCVKCWPWGEPHFRAFSGATFDWHVPCKHALAQEGFSMNPAFGVFMTFKKLTTTFLSPTFSTIGPTIYKEGSIAVELDPNNLYSYTVKVGAISTTITTTPTQVKGSLGTIYAWKKTKFGCIWMYGISKILIELCKWQLTIWAPEWNSRVFGWPGGYPQLGGLCSTNNLDKTLVARNRTAYPPPNAKDAVDISETNSKPRNFAECNEDFGLSWQTNWGQLPGSKCPEKPYGPIVVNADPRTVCSDVNISPYHEECHEIILNSMLTGPDADMFNQTCTFDLCIVDKYVNSTILTKGEMADGYKQITMQAKAQEGYTIAVNG